MAKGNTDREIGEILGISQQTVHKHIETAKKRLGVRSRIQLVVRALWENRLDLAEVAI